MRDQLRQCSVINTRYARGATCLDVRECARKHPGKYSEELLCELLDTNTHLCNACVLRHILSGEEPQYPASQDDLLSRVAGLQAIVEYLNHRVGGETVGDTLIRFAGLLAVVLPDEQNMNEDDWRSWLRDCGARLNEAAEAKGGER